MNDELVKNERVGRVEHITLNRPHKANALNGELMSCLSRHLTRIDADDDVSVVVISGQQKFFAAGADVAQMVDMDSNDVMRQDFPSGVWECVARLRKPIVAAVTGYATGGGCELVQACDVVIAGESARFGQPELGLGTIPGLGGTQRLPRLIGKLRAMDWCLRARILTAPEAYEAGLVTRIVPDGDVVNQAMAYAEEVSQYSLPVLLLLKESINNSLEMSLANGLAAERNLFHATFSLQDRREGMQAFVEKRKPVYRHA